jgi:hypothetical protein
MTSNASNERLTTEYLNGFADQICHTQLLELEIGAPQRHTTGRDAISHYCQTRHIVEVILNRPLANRPQKCWTRKF